MSEHYLTKHNFAMSRKDRETLLGQKGSVLWLMGLSGSGKSTIANQIEVSLAERGLHTKILDGDALRHGLCSDLSFGNDDRTENLRRAAEVAKLFAESGIICICCFITPFETQRNLIRNILGEDLNEIYIKANLETCEARDPKGLYKKARSGELPQFTGISSPFEEPQQTKVTIDTSLLSIDECTQKILTHIKL